VISRGVLVWGRDGSYDHFEHHPHFVPLSVTYTTLLHVISKQLEPVTLGELR
jgi:hypothetical protein